MLKKISKFLAVLTLLPVAILLIFVGIATYNSFDAYTDAKSTLNRSLVVEEFDNLVHQVQLERGMTAAYLGDNTDRFKPKLDSQRQSTDRQWQELTNLETIIQSDPLLLDTYDLLKTQWLPLSQYRTNIDNRSEILSKALGYYTSINKIILDNNYKIGQLINNPRMSSMMSVVADIAYLKEYAGIERAVLSNGFAKNSFDIALYSQFIALVTRQNIAINNAKNLAHGELLKALNSVVGTEADKPLKAFRDKVRTSLNEQPNRDPNLWFETATKRIEGIRNLEINVFSQIEALALQEKRQSSIEAFSLLLLMVSIILLASFIFTIMRRRQQQANLILYSAAKLKNNQDISASIEVIIEDNIGDIAKALNEAFEQLDTDISEFQQSAKEITSAAEHAATTTHKSKENLLRQSGSVEKLKQFTSSVNTSIHADLQDIAQANVAVEETKSQVHFGRKSVDETVTSIQMSAKTLNSVGSSVSNLDAKIKDIESMVEVIRSVADQTNLLALNAAIEAARAGEQGRGFAVVADEVRALAKRTQQSTQQIDDIVKELIKSSLEATRSIEHSVDEIAVCVDKSESITDVLEHVVTGMDKLEKMMKTVSASANDQSSQITAMNKQVDTIGDASTDNLNDAEFMATTAQQLSCVAASMKIRTSSYTLRQIKP